MSGKVFDMKRLRDAIRKELPYPFSVRLIKSAEVRDLGWADPPCPMIVVSVRGAYVHVYDDGEASHSGVCGFHDFTLDPNANGNRYVAAARTIAEFFASRDEEDEG